MLSSLLRISGSSSTTSKGLGRMDSVGRENVSAILCGVPLILWRTVTEIQWFAYH